MRGFPALFMSLFFGARLVALPLPAALAKLSRTPATPAVAYTLPLEENLIRSFARESRTARKSLPPGLSRAERRRRLYARIAEENSRVLRALDAGNQSPAASSVDEKLIGRIYTQLAGNRVARVDAVGTYDTRGDVGFCFGRALFAHYLLVENGVDVNRIAKIFAVGKLRYLGQLWDFHMATMVQAGSGQWWVIDNLFERPLPHAEWMKRATAFGIDREYPEVRFYVTDARKFQPAYGAYRLRDLREPELHPYFSELFSTLP